MKNVFQVAALTVLCCLFTYSGYSQNETAAVVPAKVTAVVDAPVAQSANKPLIITLKNSAEKSVAIFAGPKEEIKDPRITVVGGSSKNTLYLKENDAVCLMTADKHPVACTIIKPGATMVEINVSANAISSK